MTIFNFLTLLGSLSLFLFGMSVMGTALEKRAGGSLKAILAKLTNGKFSGLLTGLAVTAVIQSSSATTVMVVGFVNSGLLSLKQSIPVIMGANIGTTVTAWLLSLSGINGDSLFVQLLKPSSFTPVLAVIGIILYLTAKGKKKDTGLILLGFATLMFGMESLSGSVSGLRDDPNFTKFFLLFSNPILGVLAGALLTAIIQSSSASVGILQALSATGAITFGSALPIILGQNIGTCVTALLSSIGTSKNAKRVAVVHLYFNIIGTVLFLTVFYLLNAFIGFSFVDGVVGAKEIAIVHTIFNLSTSIILLPFIKVLEKLAYLTVKDKEGEGNKDNIEEQFKLLDERFLQSPSFAVEKCRELTNRMGEIAKESIDMAMSICVDKYDKEKAEQIAANEAAVDLYEDRLGTYLVKLSSRDLSAKDSQSVSTILHVIGDFERISDHAMNMVSVAEEKQQKDLNFTSQATAEVKVMCSAVRDVLDIAMEAFEKHDLELATRVEPLEEVVDKIRTKLKNRHVKRLQTGECTIEMGFVFSDLLTNLERVSDHCSNIAVCLIQENDESFDVHEYVQMLKNSGEGFDGQVKRYSEKYALPAKEF